MIRRTALVLAALAATAVALPAAAQSAPSRGPFTVLLRQPASLLFMDHGSIRREGAIAHVSSFIALDEATLQATSQVAYMEMFNQFDCSAVKARTVSGTGYRRDGTVMGDTPGNQDWGTIDPTSPNGEMFDVACRNGRPRGETLTGGNPTGVAASFRLSARGS